jgi:phosphatidylserine/phosphatidylglycerophosphate/cardiolipin synthase-like enzyme
MPRFVEGDKLNAALIDLIKNADEYLFLISPYIKLHSRIKDQLKLKRSLAELQIIIVFGKSEDGQSNRISEEDLTFLKEFPNIQIRYEKSLHAKYYASEDGALITSLNLYDFSQNNNIEVGVWMDTPKSLIGKLTGWGKDSEIDEEAFEFFDGVIENSEILFEKKPIFEDGFLSLSRRYIESKIKINEIDSFFNRSQDRTAAFTGFKSFNKGRFQPAFHNNPQMGFCIRTGKEIPFNPKKPYSAEAYRTWSQFGNEDYPEKFCHKTGRASDGKTSFRNPII